MCVCQIYVCVRSRDWAACAEPASQQLSLPLSLTVLGSQSIPQPHPQLPHPDPASELWIVFVILEPCLCVRTHLEILRIAPNYPPFIKIRNWLFNHSCSTHFQDSQVKVRPFRRNERAFSSGAHSLQTSAKIVSTLAKLQRHTKEAGLGPKTSMVHCKLRSSPSAYFFLHLAFSYLYPCLTSPHL